jgi:flagellar hook protein FlgE
MLRSLYAGVSGLRTHQQMMDVTGNNIANVSTSGFKSSATVFQDTLSQTLAGAAAPTTAGTVPPFGGTNPAQIGLGVRMAGISTNLAQGSSQLTGRATDIAVQGDGYFVIQTGNENLYTRAGSFNLDARGQLVTPSGGLVMSTENQPISVPVDGSIESFTIAPDGKVTGVRSDGSGLQELGQIQLATFANPAGLAKVGGSLLRATVNSGPVIAGENPGVPGADGRGLMAVGVLEMSNVDLAQEFTNLIVAQRGFQANSRIITASDEVLQDLVNLKR